MRCEIELRNSKKADMSTSDQNEMNTESQYQKSLGLTLLKAREALIAVSKASKMPWGNNPSTGVRAFLGHSLSRARRHFSAVIILCEEKDLFTVANVHRRQMFELFLQVRYFLSPIQDDKEYLAEKIAAWGCVELLEKFESSKQGEDTQRGYADAQEQLSRFQQRIIDEIKSEKRQNKHNWFGSSFSQLAKAVSGDGQDLRLVYQVISNDIHGTWGLALDVSNPEPGVLDFRSYPDKATMYR